MGIQINGNTDNISATDGGLSVSGFELNQTGVSTFHSHLHVADQIIHLDDSNSKIRFPAADTITAETAGTERLRITSSGEVKIMNTSGTVGLYFQSSSGAVSNFRAIGTNNQSLGYFFGNSEKVRFESSGHLLVNTTSVGGGSYDQLTVAGGIKITDDSNSKLEIGRYSSSSANSYIKIGSNSASLRITNAADAADLFTFTNSGLLLIGTTTEGVSTADDLTIATSGNTGITIRSGTSSNGNIFFADGTSGNAELEGYIQYDHSGNYMRFATGATERLRIKSDGEVLINGDGSGTGYLRVVKDRDSAYSTSGGNNQDLIIQQISDGTNTGGYSALALQCNYTGQTGAWVAINAVRTGVGEAALTVNPRNNSTGDVERLRIDSSGRVMIGTTTEGYGDADDLTIATAGNTGMTIRAGASNYGSIFFSDATSGNGEYDGFIQYGHAGQRLDIGVASATKLNVFSNGNLTTQGNNTGNPVGMELRNNNTAAYSHAQLTLTSQNATSSKIWCDVPNARLRMQYNGGTTVDIDQSGNIHVPSGSGISFAASGNFSLMNSEVLDDYEEGYWTPTIGGHASNGSTTYGNQKGSYVRVGGIVHLNWYISWTSTNASGQFRIYGMPYTAATTYGTNYNITTGSMMFDSINVPYQYGQMVPYLAHGVNQLVFYSSYHTGGWSILSHDSYTADGGAMICSITYRAA